MFVRVKKIGGYEFLYLVENAREGGRHVQRVIKSLGRGGGVEGMGALEFADRLGGPPFPPFDRAVELLPGRTARDWKRLSASVPNWCSAACGGISAVAMSCADCWRTVTSGSTSSGPVLAVVHRLMVSGSDRHASEWRHCFRVPGAADLALDHAYKAMTWLGEEIGNGRVMTDAIEEALYRHRQPLLGEVSVAFFDTTSLWFEGRGGASLGQRGHSKDYRPHLNQVVLGRSWPSCSPIGSCLRWVARCQSYATCPSSKSWLTIFHGRRQFRLYLHVVLTAKPTQIPPSRTGNLAESSTSTRSSVSRCHCQLQFSELNPLSDATGGLSGSVDWVARVCDHTLAAARAAGAPDVRKCSAISFDATPFDAIVTDPPYYDAIPYSDLMDFFYVWLRRGLSGSGGTYSRLLNSLGTKWSSENNDGELIDDASRFDGDKARSKANYQSGMARAFQSCGNALTPDGRLVLVFANKKPNAWETLVSALIRAGFLVDGSWPIQTERQLAPTRLRPPLSIVRLARVQEAAASRPGWDNTVLGEMHEQHPHQLRHFWDAGIRGPDFVWAATGPRSGGLFSSIRW